MGIEPTNSASERPQTYALDHAATGTGNASHKDLKFVRWNIIIIIIIVVVFTIILPTVILVINANTLFIGPSIILIVE